GVDLPGSTLPGVVVSVLVGTLALAALGFAVAAVVPAENGAAHIAHGIVLPLEFISGIFVPADNIPDWMNTVAGVFPVKPLFDSLMAAFDPTATGIGVDWGALAVVAAWGVVGGLVALRRFRWSPRS